MRDLALEARRSALTINAYSETDLYRKGKTTMTNTIGDVRGINGNSQSLNGQAGQGTQKPMPSMKADTPVPSRPTKPADGAVSMPK